MQTIISLSLGVGDSQNRKQPLSALGNMVSIALDSRELTSRLLVASTLKTKKKNKKTRKDGDTTEYPLPTTFFFDFAYCPLRKTVPEMETIFMTTFSRERGLDAASLFG